MSDPMVTKEMRVRLGAKQTAKGAIQMDITAEAPTVDEAATLLGGAIDALVIEVSKRGLTMAHE